MFQNSPGYLVSHQEHCIFSTCRTKGKYGEGEKSEKFQYVMSLVLLQTIINSAFAKGGETFFSHTPDKHICVCTDIVPVFPTVIMILK